MTTLEFQYRKKRLLILRKSYHLGIPIARKKEYFWTCKVLT